MNEICKGALALQRAKGSAMDVLRMKQYIIVLIRMHGLIIFVIISLLDNGLWTFQPLDFNRQLFCVADLHE